MAGNYDSLLYDILSDWSVPKFGAYMYKSCSISVQNWPRFQAPSKKSEVFFFLGGGGGGGEGGWERS